MTINTEDFINSIMESLDRIEHIKAEDIPNIDLYMDQVTTFMEDKLKPSTRHPGEDKILTKTMINNYAKNNLLPPPVKKKYTKDHIMMLIFIYYYKGILSISDIQELFGPIANKYFGSKNNLNLEAIYTEIFGMEASLIEGVKKDVADKYDIASKAFPETEGDDKAFLEMFSFVSLLGFDVYVKQLLIEKIIDNFREKMGESNK